MKSLIFLMIALMSTSCLKSVEDGRVPAEYLDVAKAYQGTYTATLKGKSGTLNIRLVGDKPVVTVKGFHGGDVLGFDCRSQVEELKLIEVGKSKATKKPYLVYFEFRIDKGNCSEDLRYPHYLAFYFKAPEKNAAARISIRVDRPSSNSDSLTDSITQQNFKQVLKKKAGL